MTIRTRLLLLVLSWTLPALLAALWGVHAAAQSEREAHVRTLSQTARALTLLLDSELAQRTAVARALAQLPALDALPVLDAQARADFLAHAGSAMRGLGGWVELRVPGRTLASSREGAAPAAAPAALAERAQVSALVADATGPLHAVALFPVERQGRVVGNVAVTMLTSEMQRIVDQQRLPPSWYVGVVDPQHRLAARAPGGQSFAGQRVSPSLRERRQAAAEGLTASHTLEGKEVTGYYSTTPQGWSFIVSMPTPQFGGYLATTVLSVGLGGLLLMGLAVAGTLWVSRSISGPVLQLQRAARQLQNGELVAPMATGISECDSVAEALARASSHLHGARHELENQVADAVRRTREAEQAVSQAHRIEALGRLTGGVAHDFNNLLGVISNSARLVQRQVERVPELRMPVGATLRAVEVGQRLTQHLLRVAGRRPVRPEPVHLDQYLPEVAEMLRSVLGRRIEVSTEIAPDTPTIAVDSSELELALINLAVNARDAMPEGGTLHVAAGPPEAVDMAGLPDGRYVRIVVADNGSGIAAELSDRVFEPFFTTKGVGQGTGLGLSQVHGFCTQAGGTTRLASQPGQGTRVTLVLPAAAHGLQGADAGFDTTQSSVDGLHVLLVDDNAALAEVTQALLEANGCRVHAVRSAAEALQHLESAASPFDVVLSDVVMPGPMDGIALAKALRRTHPGLPVVLVSGYSSALNAVREFTVLRKPVPEDELLAALRSAVTHGAPTAHA